MTGGPRPAAPTGEGRTLGARVVVAGTRSGSGKTTVATGLMAALARRGRRVAAAKVGPDFIDPGYHTLATGRPGRNLDVWMSGPDMIGPLAGRAAGGTDILVVEGVMGLFDGAADGTPSSTADVARLLDAPVVLVVDTSSMSQSVAAVVHGYRTWDPTVGVAAVILNMVASDSHEQMLRAALAPTGVPVLGAIRRDDPVAWRSRHLGLRPVVEDPTGVRESLDRLASVIERRCDLGAIARLAATAPSRRVPSVPQPARGGRVRIGVAAGPAFSFCYPDNLEALEAAGAELVPFDPGEDPALPDGLGGVVAGGGFPEVFAESLSSNGPMLASLRSHHRGGGVVWAECGGLLWLTRSLDGWPMAGIIDTTAELTPTRVLGYRTATTTTASPLGPAGTGLRGHEFHYSATAEGGGALRLEGRHGTSVGGWAGPDLLASYLHVHLAAAPQVAESIVRRAASAPGAAVTMRKTSVYLPDTVKTALADAAHRTGRSEADLIRVAVERIASVSLAGRDDAEDRAVRRPLPTGPRLVGVGVGPGDPDLLTDRARRLLRAGDRVFAATTSVEAVGRAEAVVRAAEPEVGVERLVLDISPGERRRRASVTAAAERIAACLDAGELVALALLGDPNLFSPFASLCRALRRLRPDAAVETVPGIMAFQELAARTGTVVVEDGQRAALLTLGDADGPVRTLLEEDDTAVVVCKGGRALPALAAALDDLGRLDGTVVGELLGLPGERTVPLRRVADRPGAYLATTIVPARRGGR